MARWLLKRCSYAIVYFSSRGFTSNQLFPVTWGAIRILEATGLEVASAVCDGATPNRRFFRTRAIENWLNMSEEGVVYWVTNRYDFSRKIFFFSDPLHLIKTIRNSFENSGGHSYTRNHMVSEASIFSLCITGQHQRFYLFVVTISTNLTYPCLTFNISCYRRDPHLA